MFLTMKKGFYRELTRVFGFKVQGANHYLLESDEFTACVLLDFWRQAFYIFQKKKQTDETTLEFL